MCYLCVRLHTHVCVRFQQVNVRLQHMDVRLHTQVGVRLQQKDVRLHPQVGVRLQQVEEKEEAEAPNEVAKPPKGSRKRARSGLKFYFFILPPNLLPTVFVCSKFRNLSF